MIPVLLSGGSGTRLWPLSRAKTPKQFCKFFENSLQQMTLERVGHLGSPWIVTNVELKDLTLSQMRMLNIPAEHLILEPKSKNTGPAIALLCQILSIRGSAYSTVGIFPADHLIEDERKFLAALQLADECAKQGKIVTLGIQPDHPATGFGYIQVKDDALARKGEFTAKTVECFHEKPKASDAEAFLKNGNFFWNAGIFIFRVDSMIELFKKHQPQMWSEIQRLSTDLRNLEEIYSKIESISIDYAILEKLSAEELCCIPVDIGWNDVGSWDAISSLLNSSSAEVVESFAKGNFVHSTIDKTYAFGDVDDLILIDTKDALLVTKKGSSQCVKEVVETLKLKDANLIKQHPDEERPWGRFEILKNTEHFKSKVIQVEPGQQLSYQSHNHREEHWLIIRGHGEIVLDDKIIPIQAGSHVHIPVKAKHRIRNTGADLIEFVEVQLGSYFGEDDIIRYQDDYQRQ